MKYFIRLSSVIILTLIGFSSCHSQNNGSYPTECIKLNDEAMYSLTAYEGHDTSILNKDINLLEQAIACDSTNIIFYLNISGAYDQKHDYKRELKIDNKILLLTDNQPSFLLEKGMLYERMGKGDSATLTYDFAQKKINRRLAKNPEDVESIKANGELKALTAGAKEALIYMNEQVKLHPKISSKLSTEASFYDYFDRNAYVFHLPVLKNLTKKRK